MPKKKSNRLRTISTLIIAILAFMASFVLMLMYPIQELELTFKDQLFEWRGPLDVSESPIVLIEMSDKADEEIPEKFPWPTSIYARLVENLNEAGAKVIAFDVIFDNPDEHNAQNDTLFAEAIKESGNVILAGDLKTEQGSNADIQTTLFPIPVLNTNNPNRVALVRVVPDIDGAIRSYSFGNEHMGTHYYRMALEILREYNDIPYEEIDEIGPNEDGFFKLGPYDILKDRPNSFIINYFGPEGMFPTISLDEVIDDSTYTTVLETEMGEMNTFDQPGMGHLSWGTFEDKIVIVGSTMPTLRDFYTTPFANEGNNDRPGFEIHAHALQTILDANYIDRLSGWFTLAIMLIFCFSVTMLNRFFSANIGSFLSFTLGVGYFGIACFAFIEYNLFMVVTGPLLAVVITQASMVGFEFYLEQKEKRRIRGMFASYVSPELVNQMIESGEEPQLGGEETYMTAFFSDIVSFSTFSEKLEAKELVKLINEYLSAMTEILNKKGGTLDKYIGDAIVSFFGSPVHMKDHAYQACISTQLMHKELASLRDKWKEDGWPDIVVNMQHRIGLNTGLMVTGNMGSSRRFNYTMMGDNVNLAARCESGAKQYGVFTMVTESTKEEAEKYGDDCVFRLLDHIVVKGRTQPVKVYEIADLKTDATQELFDCIKLYEEGMEHYFDQEWDKAIAKFKASEKLERYKKNPSGIFIERCKLMKQDPPSTDWNGVFVMTSK